MGAVFPPLFKAVSDPRDPSRKVYPLPGLCFAGLLLYLCRLGARRRMGELLRTSSSAGKFKKLFGVEAFPHGDTLGKLACRLVPAELQECVCTLTEGLIRKKFLYPYRLLERFFVVAVDGTGMLTFPERHCPHCLTAVHNGKTFYYHHVLEAKLVTSNGLAFSLMTEFIENPEPDTSKQDCELKAFYRLAKRIKKRFPRLPICLSLDGLYAGGPAIKLCEDLGWKYVITLKDGDLPSVNSEFQALLPLQEQNRQQIRLNNTVQDYRWAKDIEYQDSKRRTHRLHVLELCETVDNGDGKVKKNRFKWITNIDLQEKNVAQVAHQGGRIRWKIENEGFNVQKNGGFGLEHAYVMNWNAAQVFYYLLQIAHILSQLMEKGSELKKIFPQGVGSAKDLAFLLLEAWRNAKLDDEDYRRIKYERFQFRIDSS